MHKAVAFVELCNALDDIKARFLFVENIRVADREHKTVHTGAHQHQKYPYHTAKLDMAQAENHEHDKQLKERTAYIHNFLSHKRFLQAL